MANGATATVAQHRTTARSSIESSQKTYTTGLSDVPAYGSYRGSASVLVAGERVREVPVRPRLPHDQGHVITGRRALQPELQPLSTSWSQRAGLATATGGTPGQRNFTYTATGVPNPNYRATINDRGQALLGRRQQHLRPLRLRGVVMF